MGMFRRWLFQAEKEDSPELLSAIERAVTRVEPLLKQTGQYPQAYRQPVKHAMEYAHRLALSVPAPVNLDAYATNAYVHAIFPSMDNIPEAFRSSQSMQDYLREHPASNEIYALMGMRRFEKNVMGMELSGQVIQQDVPQQMVYFANHTIDSPAPGEAESRKQVAWRFFDSLVDNVAKRVALRKQQVQSQRQALDQLRAKLRIANALTRPALESELSQLLNSAPSPADSLDLNNYPGDFEAVLLKPEEYLRLNEYSMILDGMGIKRDAGQTAQGKLLVFNELIGLDRRDWTVTMVHIRNIQNEAFNAGLETAHRMLAL